MEVAVKRVIPKKLDLDRGCVPGHSEAARLMLFSPWCYGATHTARHYAYLGLSVSMRNPGSWVLGLGSRAFGSSWPISRSCALCPPMAPARFSLSLCFSHCDRTAHLTVLPPAWGCFGVRRPPAYRWPLPLKRGPCPPLLCPVASFLTAQPLTTIPHFCIGDDLVALPR